MKLIVIGAGPGGERAVRDASRLGHETVLVEAGAFGGTCTNRGCIPTKFLLGAVTREVARSGKPLPGETWRTMQRRRAAFIRGLSEKIGKDLAALPRTRVMQGRGELINPREVLVHLPDGEREQLAAEAVILACGSSPLIIPAFNIDGERILTSTELLAREEIPATLAVVGSGAVGLEFARLFTILGTKVTVIEALPRILPTEDDDVAAVMTREIVRAGTEIITGVAVEKILPGADAATVILADGRTVTAECVLVSVGRRLETANLGLETCGIAVDRRGAVTVNGQLETSAPGIFAVGDMNGRLLLAHAAWAEATVAVERLSGGTREIDFDAVPAAIFTDPEVASVGHNPRTAAAAGIDAVSATQPLSANIKARLDMDQRGFTRVTVERTTKRIIGGTVVGERAAEMIHVLALAVQRRLTVEELRRTVFVHPSLSETFPEALEQLL